MKHTLSTPRFALTLPLAIALLLAAAPAAAQLGGPWSGANHPEEVLAQSREARRRWHAAVPAALRRQAWLYDLRGTAGAIGTVRIGHRDYLTGIVCRPHDCGPHTAAWLIARDGRRAVGAIDLNPSRRGPRRELFFGGPTPAERARLRASLYAGREAAAAVNPKQNPLPLHVLQTLEAPR